MCSLVNYCNGKLFIVKVDDVLVTSLCFLEENTIKYCSQNQNYKCSHTFYLRFKIFVKHTHFVCILICIKRKNTYKILSQQIVDTKVK